MTVATEHLFSVDEYVALYERQVLGETARTELLDGRIYEMAPISDLHAGKVDRLNAALVPAVGERAIVRVQSHIQISSRSMPQPDVAVLRWRSDFYETGRAQASDVLLIVEVAVTSLAHDRDVKLPLYAAAGVPEVWIVEPAAVGTAEGDEEEARSGTVLTVYREPRGRAYSRTERVGAADTVEVPGTGSRFRVSELLGAP